MSVESPWSETRQLFRYYFYCTYEQSHLSFILSSVNIWIKLPKSRGLFVYAGFDYFFFSKMTMYTLNHAPKHIYVAVAFFPKHHTIFPGLIEQSVGSVK